MVLSSKERELEKELSSSSSAIGVTTLPATLLLTGVCEPLPGSIYPEARGVAVGSIDVREYVNEAAAGAYAAATRAGCRPPPEIQIHHVDDIHLDNYGLGAGRARPQQQQPRRFETEMTTTLPRAPKYAPMGLEACATLEHRVSLWRYMGYVPARLYSENFSGKAWRPRGLRTG